MIDQMEAVLFVFMCERARPVSVDERAQGVCVSEWGG